MIAPEPDAPSTAADALDAYAAGLCRGLERFQEPPLGDAYAIGRAALNERRGLIDLVLLHHSCLEAALPVACDADQRRALFNAAGEFLAESLSPFEMAYRGFLDSNEALRGVNETLEREAKRVARLLHDGAGQILFALQLAIAALERGLPPRSRAALEDIRDLTRQLDDQLHSHSRELYPVVLEDLGLAPAIRELVESVNRRSELNARFRGSLARRPPADVESAVYRAVQEALTNVLKHARATRVTIALSQVGNMLTCSVTDNGVGGAVVRPHGDGRRGLGLISIRERMKLVMGSVHIRSTAGRGTEVRLTVPLPNTDEGTSV